jgi:amino acid adenylation domain-containing protein
MTFNLDSNVFDIFADVAARQGSKVAVDDGEHCFTYEEVHDRALKLARRIAAVVPHGEPVGILLPNGAKFPIAILAALAAGCPIVALDPTFPQARNAFIAKHAGMKAIVVDDGTRDYGMQLGVPQLDFATPALAGVADMRSSVADDVAVISYTSGSTGEPKGAFHTQRNLLHHIRLRLDTTALAADDRVALVTGTTVLIALHDILSGLLAGATLFIVDLRRHGLQELIRVMRRWRITTMRSLPIIVRQLIELCPDADAFASLRHVFLSSDRLFSADIELFRKVLPADCRLSASMGATETQMIVHWFIPSDRLMKEPVVPVGHVQPDFEVALVDDAGAPALPGRTGEIVVTGRYLALGYWRNDVETKRAFGAAAGDPLARSYRTGDLGRMNPDGLLELRGRKDRQVKIRGNRIEPVEIEATIRAHPQVRDVAVIARRDRGKVELVAYVVASGVDGISEWLRERLPEPMRPRHVYFIDEIPTLGNFKHDLRSLEEIDRTRAGLPARSDMPPADETAEAALGTKMAVHAVWGRLLGSDAVGRDRPWEEAGGDSMKSLELIFDLEKALGRRISMRLVGPSTRPSDLIASLQGDRKGASNGRPSLFLLGASGDFLSLLRLAESLSSEAKVEVLDYAPVDLKMLRFVAFDDLIADVIGPIRTTAQRGEPIRLLGWSLGGLVAIAVARLLAAEGHTVEFVGVLDTSSAPLRWDSGNTDPDMVPKHLSDQVDEPIFRHIRRSVRKGTAWQLRPNRAATIILQRLLHRRQLTIVAGLWRLLNLMRLRKVSIRFGMKVTRFIHANAARNGAHALSYAGPLALFRSSYQEWDRLNMPDDLGWSDSCAGVSIWRVPGDHWSLMAEGNVKATARAVIEALRQSGARASTALNSSKIPVNPETSLAADVTFRPGEIEPATSQAIA